MPQLPTSSDREYRYNYNQDSSFSTLRNVLTTKLAAVSDIIQQARTWYLEQSTIKQILLGGALVVIGVISVLMVIFHIHIIRFLIYLSDEWHNLKYGSLIIFALVFMVGFPIDWVFCIVVFNRDDIWVPTRLAIDSKCLRFGFNLFIYSIPLCSS